MKITYLTLFLVATSFVASCAQTINGNGVQKTETRTVSSFTGVASSGAFDVTVVYGDAGTAIVDAEENLLPNIETTVENNTLYIRTAKGIRLNPTKKIKITVSASALNSLALSGSGSLVADGKFSGDKMGIAIAGSGHVRFNFDRYQTLDATISGSGDIQLNGAVRDFNASVNGSGDIGAYGLTADNVNVSISGSGDVEITANKSLSASLSGSGGVRYRGNATNVTQQTTGSGKVRKA